MRSGGAKDVPNTWDRDPNLSQTFSAFCGQGKQEGRKTGGVTYFRVTNSGHVSISYGGDSELRAVLARRARLSSAPSKVSTLMRKCPILGHSAKQFPQEIAWWGKHPNVSTAFSSSQESLWQKNCTHYQSFEIGSQT